MTVRFGHVPKDFNPRTGLSKTHFQRRNPVLGGDWLCTAVAPGDPDPGFTPGRAFRLLFEQAVADGYLDGWSLDD